MYAPPLQRLAMPGIANCQISATQAGWGAICNPPHPTALPRAPWCRKDKYGPPLLELYEVGLQVGAAVPDRYLLKLPAPPMSCHEVTYLFLSPLTAGFLQMIEQADKLAVLRRRPDWDKDAAAAKLEVRCRRPSCVLRWPCSYHYILLTRAPSCPPSSPLVRSIMQTQRDGPAPVLESAANTCPIPKHITILTPCLWLMIFSGDYSFFSLDNELKI